MSKLMRTILHCGAFTREGLKAHNKFPRRHGGEEITLSKEFCDYVKKRTDAEGLDAFAREGLKVHNEYRRRHGVVKMILSKELCDFAKEWADTCAKIGNMALRPNNKYGENIFSMYSLDFSYTPRAKEAVKAWYDKIKDYKFGSETINDNTLHFTQVIWRNSTTLGIAMSKNSKGHTFVVANYEPAGNVVGQFTANVPKVKA